jgi:hypothetical protein
MSNQTPSTKKSNKELLDKILSEYEIGFITHGKNVDEHLRNFKQAIQAHIDKKVNEVLDRVEAEATPNNLMTKQEKTILRIL